MKKILLIMIGLSCLVQAEIIRDSATGIVRDTATKLEWQDDVLGNSMAWEAAITQCEVLILGGHSDWRLPNINELKSIVDRSKFDPAIVTGFINTSSSFYWSSNTYESSRSYAWDVGFYGGRVYYSGYKEYDGYVRCVRDGE